LEIIPKGSKEPNNIRTNSVAFKDLQSADSIKGIVCLSEIKKDQIKGTMFDMGILHAQYKFKDGSASASGRSKTMERIMESDAGFKPSIHDGRTNLPNGLEETNTTISASWFW
jgi:nucleoside 2-deoxyribosyltransferase